MAGRGPRTGGGRRTREDARAERSTRGAAPAVDDLDDTAPARVRDLDESLVRIRDLAGRPRGTGFVADHHGTVITSHEAVDGLPRLVLHAAGDRTCLVTADAVTPLPALDLALVRTEGLGVDPLPVTVRDRVETGTYVRVAADRWREARLLGATSVTYTATDRFHLLDDALELAIGTAGRDALRLGGGAAGGPVLDAVTGAVIGVLGTALQSGQRDTGFAVPLRQVPGGERSLDDINGRLGDLLARNAATVPAYGADLNLAGVLELTATSVGSDGPPGALAGFVGPGRDAEGSCVMEPVERPSVIREFTEFAAGPAAVLGLVGAPGSGRTTELAALAARRNGGAEPAPTLWLRGADLRDGDASVADAVRRTVERAARIVAASVSLPGDSGDLGDVGPERLARVARDAGRPLLLLLDGPEEMPPVLAHRLDEWTRGTGEWLRESGARLVVGCRAEYWEGAGAGFPGELLYGGSSSGGPAVGEDGPDRSGVPAADHAGPDRSGASAADRAGPAYSGAPGADRAGPLFFEASVSDAAGPAHSGAPAPDDAGPCSSARPAFEDEAVQADGGSGGAAPRAVLPACVHLGDLRPDEARRARAAYGLPEGVLTGADARHPLTLRLLSEVLAALPASPGARLDRDDVFAAYLDLMCLRIAVRLAAENGLRGTAVRRLAAKVSGQVHEAARRSLGPGQGELDRESFEVVFPWGPAPARLGGGTGWASAVLTEGLLVPAGTGYRFAHEELADWIQGTHLDLDEALRALVHRSRTPRTGHPLPVPHHRIGPVVQALLLLARQHGTLQLAVRLEELAGALDADPDSWWAARLLAGVLLRVPDATPYSGALRLLADQLVARRQQQAGVPKEFAPEFWTALRLPQGERLALLRRLVLVDGAPQGTAPARFLDTAAELLAADPTAVQPLLTRWFDDERPLPATPEATVATAAQALLHTHRRRALDDLTEVLVGCAHGRADELLAVLAEEEPSAVCRAVDRWAHDERPARRVAAVAYGLRAAPHVRTEADRELLRYAAQFLLARPADSTLHGGALALLVRDPHTRARHLPQALRHFASGDPQFPPSALAAALTTHPEPVLEAFRARLHGPHASEAVRTLADVATPALARRAAALVRETAVRWPETAAHLGVYVDRCLDHGPTARALLFPLVTGLLDGGPASVRTALAAVLAAPGTPASRPLRRELLEFQLTHEHDPAVLDALLHTAGRRDDDEIRDLVHRTGRLLVRTPAGATRFDRGLVDLGRHVPGFAALMARWLADTPEDWAAVVGPSTRRMIENLAGVGVPA
ncbi:trypsin-like peptidase domain-containing protein [Streptomyces sp. NBC_00989]|uniref:trypsin-like peptidase domain-containing protein n=1 Tax=Streptomyces sp. NBC_00989 TaxID=2903705 RepID=UPI00386626E6|nr:serine protease [Streptomyces sp. NBC_00989]